MQKILILKQGLLLTLLQFVLVGGVYSQALEANHWYFGYGSGLTFFPNGPQPELNGIHRATDGVASVSDNKGNLLFYSDRRNIYNHAHDTMKGGKNIFDSRSNLIVRNPGNVNLYWLFTIESQGYIGRAASRCAFFEIDMNSDSGLGEVISSSGFKDTLELAGISLFDHSNGIDKWLVFKDYNSESFISYHISTNGIDFSSRVKSSFGQKDTIALCRLKSSPNSEYLSVTNYHPKNNFELYKFDKANGRVYSELYRTPEQSTQPNSVVSTGFSPNSKVLFVSYLNKLLAYDISSEDSAIVGSTRMVLDSNDLSFEVFLDLQIGLDGKVYFLNSNRNDVLSRKLSRIVCPESVFSKLVLEDTIIGPLGSLIGQFLPTLNQTLYVNTHKLQAQSTEDTLLCSSDSTQLVAYGAGADQFVWEPAIGLSCTNCSSPKASPDSSTTYRVIGIASACTQDDFDTAYVRVNVIPEKGQTSITGDSLFCEGDSVILRGPFGFDQYEWLNDSTRSPSNFMSDTGRIQLAISNKCYTDTISKTIQYHPSLEYDFPQDQTLCAKELPITLQASSNYDLFINGKEDSLVAVTTPAQVLFEAVGPCNQASKRVLVDSLDLAPIKDWNKDSVEIEARMSTSSELYYRSSTGEWQSAEDSISFSEVGEYDVYQIRTSGACRDTLQLGDLMVYEQDITECEVQISPNPGGDFLKVESNQELEQLRMIDARGRLVYDYTGTTAEVYHINLPELAKGTYLIRMQCANNETKEMKWVRE